MSPVGHRMHVAIERLRGAILRRGQARWLSLPREKYWRGSDCTQLAGNWKLVTKPWDGPTFYCNKCALHSWTRCRDCEGDKARWRRARALADDLTAVSRFLGKSIRFVTLTIPNVEDLEDGLSDLKRRVKNLRRSKAFSGKVVGGSDFYEWTVASDGSLNVHHHGLWIGSYWDQRALTDAWGHGHTWITAIRRGRKGSKRMVSYAVKYATKMHEQGNRSRQRFGCLYGGAFAELKSALRLEETS